MVIQELLKKHIELVKSVNSATSTQQHVLADHELEGFRKALEVLHINQLMDCDRYYMDQGIHRDMCCGVFLDWKPSVGET